MRHKLFAGLLAAAALAPSAGCGSGLGLGLGGSPPAKRTAPPWLPEVHAKAKGPSTPEQDAILRVLEDNKQHYKAAFDTLEADSKPSAATRMIGDYVAQVEKLDLSGSPAEFQAALARHLKAWQQLQTVVQRLPDAAYEQTAFMDALFGLFGGSEVRGKALGGDVIKAVRRVNDTFAEVYTSGRGYGIDADLK